MTALTEVFVSVKPDMDKFGPEVKKKLNAIDSRKEGAQVATRFGLGFNGAIGGIVSRSAGVFAAGFAAIKGVEVFGGFIKDAAESARVGRISAQVVKSTGGAAKITAAQMGDLATAISNKTGADDETIQSGENLLATFTNIRNEVGKGNDIFNQASSAVTDMAAAMNGGQVTTDGVKSASIQLGKALNDPLKGITALSKVGVSFTADQKKQIETLVKSGKTMDAQKVILGELKKEFGGAAAAAGDPFTRLQTIMGNLSEEIGGYLLPYANKFADFVSNKLVPGISGLVSLVVKGDFTSSLREAFGVEEDSGFVDFLFRVHDAAVAAFGFFKTEVLPRLREFAGFVIGSVVPAIVSFIQRLVTELAPAVRSVFGFFKTEVLPRLQEFAGFLGDKVLPPIEKFASTVLMSKDFLVPFVGVLLGVAGALKVWSIAQGILNVVMSANPIGLVVIAVAALVAGIIYAYKHSEKFRAILQGAFEGIRKAAQTFAPLVKAAIDVVVGAFKFWWTYIAQPILKGFWEALKFAWDQATKFGQIVSAGFNAIKEPAKTAIKFVVSTFLTMVDSILRGAAKAFGWVPDLGPKLKSAATEFGKFRDSVNAKLAGITDQQINFTIKYSSTGVNLTTPSSVGRRAMGGAIHGPGSGTSDTAGLFALSNGEHVWTAAEVSAAGGHGAMEAMRKSVLSGKGYAKGGAVGLNPHLIADASGLASSVKAVVVAAASSAAKALAKSGGGLAGTMAFGRSQVGKPYVWGAAGPNGYDCSGFVSALINFARGRSPYHRLGATGSMPWPDMTSGTGRFMVGWFKGNPGHTAATINGVNFESAGGVGVRVGGRARGAYDSLFTNRAKVKGFAAGGAVEGDLPFDLFDPRGERFAGKTLADLGIGSYADGAWRILADHLALVHKGEMVVPSEPADNLRSLYGDWNQRVRSKLHDVHQQHVAHVAHVAHVNHLNQEGHGWSRLHPADIKAIGGEVVDGFKSSPVRLSIDGRDFDTAISRSARSRGF